MKKSYKISLIALCLLLVFTFTGCSSGINLNDPIAFNPDHVNKKADSCIAAETEQFQLIWESDTRRVILYDKIRDYKWSNVPADALGIRYDENGNEIENNPKLETPIFVQYLETDTYTIKSANAYNQSLKRGKYEFELIDNGFKITYHFDSQEFSIPVTYTISDKGLTVSVLTDEIAESGKSKVYHVSVAPFFCSVPNVAEDSYLFYPSGSGSLIYADNLSEISTFISNEVYGTDALLNEYVNIKTSNTESINLPVFGAKYGNNGIIGIVTEGSDTAIIEADVGNANIGFSSVYAIFKLRGEQTAGKVINGVQYSEQLTSTPMSVTYYPLYDDQADYVGMANYYRNYLLEKGTLYDKAEKVSASVTLIGGTKLPHSVIGIPTSKIFATTTVNDAMNIVSELKSTLDSELSVELFGFGSSGVDIGKPAGGLKVAKSIGTEKQVKKLAEYCAENNIQLFFNYDLMNFSSNGSGLTVTSGGSARAPSGQFCRVNSFWLGNGAKNSFYYMIARSELNGLAVKAMENSANMGVTGFASRNLTSKAYSDYSENKYIAKANTVKDVSEILAKAKENKFSILGYSANDYAAVYADAIIDAPVSSSKYDLLDSDIPFYQIVFKGYTQMYGTSINMVTDDNKEILRNIEAGVSPRYTFINNYDVVTINSEYQMFATVLYSDYKNKLIETVKAVKDVYTAINDATIVDHIIINPSVRKVVYSNGVSVFVNYGDEAYNSELGVVNAGSYVFGKEATADV